MSFRRADVAIEDFGIDSYQRWPVSINLKMWREHDLRFGGSQLLWTTALRAMRSNGVRATWGIRKEEKPICMFEGKTFGDMNRSHPDEFGDLELQDQMDRFIEALTDMKFSLSVGAVRLLPESRGPGALMPASFPWLGNRTTAMLAVKVLPTKTKPVHLRHVPMIDRISVDSVHVIIPYQSKFSLEIHAGNNQRLSLLPRYGELPKPAMPIPGFSPAGASL